MDRTQFRVPQCLESTAVHLLPYWPYRIYRSSVPFYYIYTITPLRAVRTLQSLGACRVEPQLYYPYGLYGFYISSVHVRYKKFKLSMHSPVFKDPQCL